MKFSVLQENLSKGLSTVGKAVATKDSLPILSNILISAENGRLKLAATDLETGIISWVKAEVEEEGSLTVPGRLLGEFINNLPAVEIKAATEAEKLNLSTEKANSVLNGVSAEEYPTLPEAGESQFMKLPPKEFSEAVSEVVFAAASDESRPILTGILIKVAGNEVTLVGVDGFRLAEAKITLKAPVEKEANLVVPARTLSEVSRVLGSSEEDIGVSLLEESNQVLFNMPGVLIFSRVLEGDFPDYEKIIPGEFTTTVKINRQDLLDSTRLASVFARDTSSVVALNFKDDQLTLLSNTAEVGSSENSLEVDIDGGDFKISFNSQYLNDFLTNVGGETVFFKGSDGLSAGLFTIEGRDNYLHLIMPVRVQE